MTFDKKTNVGILLPVIVAKNFAALPGCEVRAESFSDMDNKALSIADQYQNFVIIAYPEMDEIKADTINDLYRRATVAKIVLSTTTTGKNKRVKFSPVCRCNILELDTTSPFLLASAETVPCKMEKVEEANVIIDLIKKDADSKLATTPEEQVTSQKINLVVNQGIDLDDMADILAGLVITNRTSKIEYLLKDEVYDRFYDVLTNLRKKKYFDELEHKIDENISKNMTEAQKEYYLREKMRAIQEELGDKAKKDQDIDEMRNKIKALNLPEATLNKALNELNRYAIMAANAPESNIIKSYLDFLISLPWSKASEDTNDIEYAKKVLDEDHYGLDKVKERILEYLAVKIMTNENPQTILCLVGPPGVGKTSLAKSVARALNKKFVKQSLGGVKDESEIRGHRRTYLGALPGRILQGMAKAGVNNPVFLLDEIDKMSSDYKGDPTSAMLEVLDSEQNKFFSDNYLEEPFDLSHCFFIATANYLENIPAPLRDRLEIVQVSSYTEYEKFEIAKTHLIDKQLKLNGLDKSLFSITDQAIYEIIQHYTREAGVRELERLLGSIIRKSIKKILIEKVKKVDITAVNLEEYLGKHRFENTENTGSDYVGVVTGLAYTEFGGDTLQIEVAHYKGQGHILLTGKLGDVMKESAETALSYVKANCDKYDIDFDLFKENDIHIHVPEGATPKDGPSAGVTMATAIVSAFTNRPVDHLLGMTGEITLRGRVLPIGGLREKSIAAHRSGLKRILIPKENEKDIDEIPQSVRDSLQIIPIENAEEAIKYALK